jgi:ribosomal protein S27AE
MDLPKKSIVLMLGPIFLATFLTSLGASARGPSCMDHDKMPSKASSGGVSYTCPMHPDVTSDKPGKCPKCGMFLEAKAMEKTTYTCPMHSEVKLDQPGKCPKCGMSLEKHTEQVACTYTCPMHPEIKSDKPGKCPKCGMFLEAKAMGREPPGAPDAHSGHGH